MGSNIAACKACKKRRLLDVAATERTPAAKLIEMHIVPPTRPQTALVLLADLPVTSTG